MIVLNSKHWIDKCYDETDVCAQSRDIVLGLVVDTIVEVYVTA
jgi:hypothetical protein